MRDMHHRRDPVTDCQKRDDVGVSMAAESRPMTSLASCRPNHILALVERRDLLAIQFGGRGQWRMERAKLDAFIEQAYKDTARELRECGT